MNSEWSVADMTTKRELVKGLLDELGVEAYIFELEPRAEMLEVRVECAIEGGWQTAILTINQAQLAQCAESPEARARLFADWRKHLCHCKASKSLSR